MPDLIVCLCGSAGTVCLLPFSSEKVAGSVGSAHGGVNEACLNMLSRAHSSQWRYCQGGEFMEQVKDKSSGVKLMGFCHCVYKNP